MDNQQNNSVERDSELATRKERCCIELPLHILIRITGRDMRLRLVRTDPLMENLRFRQRTAENVRNGQSTYLYRDTFDDTGFEAVHRAKHVMLDQLHAQLVAKGYVLTDAHSRPNEVSTTNVIQFTRTDDTRILSRAKEIAMPEEVNIALSSTVFTNLFAWCNPKDSGKPDTINCFLDKKQRMSTAGRLIMTDDNSYTVVHPDGE